MTNTPGEGQTPQDPNRDPNQQPPGQPAYGQPGYGYPQQGMPPMQYAPDHPKATTALVLGILGVVVCQVLGPFAWVVGKKTVDEIDASHGQVGGRGAAQAGYILGIVGTVLLGVAILFVIVYILFFAVLIGGGVMSSGY